ncbi:hypothetical protein PMN64_12465 [Bradyrhizobium sp. UFLA01-814]|uniref:DUF6894 family protein n=1 Tax=Bradyrhizobium sp. UFLA01-814 TaxID=3023480 RepID=UPI00398AF414
MRYFIHVISKEHINVDRDGMEFATPQEADDYGAVIASEIGMDDADYSDTEVSVVNSAGHEIARHPVVRRLAS